jgi:uncharacterized protein (TIGR03643 family)
MLHFDLLDRQGACYRATLTMPKTQPMLDNCLTSRVIEMAWDDRTPFDAIRVQFALSEAAVMALMRRELKPSSYRLWRQRVRGRTSKHAVLRAMERV